MKRRPVVFCGDCPMLEITEEEQVKERKETGLIKEHICTLYVRPLKHRDNSGADHYPNIVAICSRPAEDECRIF